MNKNYLAGAIAVTVGILMMFVLKIFEVYMMVAWEVSKQAMASFGLTYFPFAFFAIAAVLFINGWWREDEKRRQQKAVQPIKS